MSAKNAKSPKSDPTNFNSELNGNEYTGFINTEEYIRLENLSLNSFYIFVDFTKMIFQYVSPNVKSITGYSAIEFEQKGYQFLLSLYHPQFASTQKAINEEINEFISEISIETRTQYLFSNDVKIRHANGEYLRFLQNSKCISLTPDGSPRLAFSQFCEITCFCAQNKQTLIITKIGTDSNTVVLKKDFYPYFENGVLTLRETEIWSMISDGLSSKEIAERANITLNTVLTHRKRIYKKIRALSN